MATSTHNKYVSIPDWFSSSSSTPITSTEKPANITNVYYGGGGGGGTTGITEIPIDNKTIVWLDLVITVPIDNDKIIINTEGKITTSGTTGVWELKQLTDGTNYIYTTYPVVTQLGITMYAGTDGLDLGSIYDGLPIDNATIYWDLDENGNKILKAVGSSGGVADSVAWANVTGKPDWLLDGKILYTEIEGIPDLSGFITKDYIDGKFVTFDLNETIDGIKTFTNGIKIGTSLINQSLNDVIYIDANLVVRGGITMYATGTVDIPSILDSLPVAGTDSKGIASFDSSYFSVTNGKVTLLADNVGLNESELAEYLNTNNYAKKSDIPSLNGYATQSWVESKGYALNLDLMLLTTKVDDFLEGSDTDTIINKWLELEAFLSGLSESDNLATILGTKADKTYVDETFVTIGGNTEQVITGAKNFTGGIKINGSPIYYDTEKKYWKLEGDLLVTGGVTMYGNEGTYTPSTIMDAILYDDTTLGINSNGQLYVKGGTSGGGLDITALQNYLTSNSYLNVTEGDNRYLKLSGGTLTLENGDSFKIRRNKSNSYGAYIAYETNDGMLGRLGMYRDNIEVYFGSQTDKSHRLLHEGNYSNYALPLSGGTLSSNSRSPLTLKSGSSENHSLLLFNRGSDYWGSIGFNAANSLIFKNTNGANYIIWNSSNFNPSDYLPLSGGTLSGNLTIQNKTVDVITLYRDDVNNSPSIKCTNKSDGTLGYIGVSGSGSGIGIQPFFMDSAGTVNKIWHSGNDGSGSGLDADKLDGVEYQNILERGFSRSFRAGAQENSATGWFRVAKSLLNNESCGIIIISRSYNYSNNESYIFAVNMRYGYASVTQIGGTSATRLITKVRVCVKYNDVSYFDLYIGVSSTLNSYFVTTLGAWESINPTYNPSDTRDLINEFAVVDGLSGDLTGSLIGNASSATKATYLKTQYSNSTSWYDDYLLYAKWATDKADHLDIKCDGYYTRVDVAKKLNTARTIWGQSFDGTGDVFGQLYLNTSKIVWHNDASNYYIGCTTVTGGARLEYRAYSGHAFLGGNVGIDTTTPAYKLDVNGTIRFASKTFWGLSFDGTGNVSGNLVGSNFGIYDVSGNPYIKFSSGGMSTLMQMLTTGALSLGSSYTHFVITQEGNVGIKTTSPNDPLHVVGDISTYVPSNNPTASVNFASSINDRWQISGRFNKGNSSDNNRLNTYYYNGSAWANIMSLFTSGDMLVSGGITMYSDQRKKTILNHVELSLKQIADAPLIEHYYNSDDKKTTHVGSIAQYWASMNDWFCKLDSEGYYTMEIQNAALASAISIARELDRYETKTDKAIKTLKKRICELEEEVERLKSA